MTNIEKLCSIDTTQYQILIRYKVKEVSINQCECCGPIGQEWVDHVSHEKTFTESIEAMKFLATLEENEDISAISVHSYGEIIPENIKHYTNGGTSFTYTGNGADVAFIPHPKKEVVDFITTKTYIAGNDLPEVQKMFNIPTELKQICSNCYYAVNDGTLCEKHTKATEDGDIIEFSIVPDWYCKDWRGD